MELDSHKSLMMSINVIGGHVTEHSCDEVKSEATNRRIDKINADWDEACEKATQWQTALQTSLMQVRANIYLIMSEIRCT